MRLLSDHLGMQRPLLTHCLPSGGEGSEWRNVYVGGSGDCHCRGKSLCFSEVVMGLRFKPPSAGLVAHRPMHHLFAAPFPAVLIWLSEVEDFWCTFTGVMLLLLSCYCDTACISLGSTLAVPPGFRPLALTPDVGEDAAMVHIGGRSVDKPRSPVCWCLSRLCVWQCRWLR